MLLLNNYSTNNYLTLLTWYIRNLVTANGFFGGPTDTCDCNTEKQGMYDPKEKQKII